MRKILIILTGGISSDGISSAWYSILRKWKQMALDKVQFELLEISEVSDPKSVAKFKKLGFNIITIPLRQSAPLRYIKTLKGIIHDREYDVVHVNGSSSFMLLEMLASRLEQVKLRIAHSRNTTCNKKLLHRILFRPFNLLTNVKLACGKEAGKWLFGKNPYTVFHNGIDLERFKFDSFNRSKVRTQLGIKEDWLALGHVGKFNFQKNHSFLLKIFSEIVKNNPKSILLLFGDGELSEEIKMLVRKLGIQDKVMFMGVVNNIDYYLSGMDGMLLPSRFEGLPNVVIEWQASGLPSIVSDSITDECKVSDLVTFIPLEDSYGIWAEKTISFVASHTNRETQSAEAIEALRANGYDIETQVLKLQEIYTYFSRS